MTPDDAIYPSLRNRSVFLTGGASGIGAETVRRFAAQGARVSFVDIQAEAGAALAAELPGVRFNVCDLKDIAALQAVIRAEIAVLGGLDVLVNNAAHDQRHDWREVTVEYWEDRLAVNLRHQFFAIQAAAPAMQAAKRGSIINLGSISWQLGMGGMPAYTTSKAGIEGLTRSFARDLGPDGIRVNCIIPGWIITERQKALWLTDAAREETLGLQCLKEMLQPDAIARMAMWLASDESRMCTSQTWTVDGGWR